jgi:DNA-binding LytR/AlgR family response regulator
MIRCVIVDDKPLAIDIIAEYISKISFLQTVYSTGNPLDALEFIRNNSVDVVLLDIQMPELTGIQFMKILNGRCKVVLTTAYSEYAMEGYEHDVVDYLLKPFSFERFYKAAEKTRLVLQQPGATNTAAENAAAVEDIFVKTEYRIQRICLNDILFIEARQNYIAIILLDRQVLSLQNIKSIEDKLHANRFARVHKSYIVALNKIDVIEKGSIQIGKHSIPIGDIYRDAFLKLIGTKI